MYWTIRIASNPDDPVDQLEHQYVVEAKLPDQPELMELITHRDLSMAHKFASYDAAWGYWHRNHISLSDDRPQLIQPLSHIEVHYECVRASIH